MKEAVILGTQPAKQRRAAHSLRSLWMVPAVCLGILVWTVPHPSWNISRLVPQHGCQKSVPSDSNWCTLPEAVVPSGDSLKPSEHFTETAHRELQIERLSKAVQVPTESYDDNGDVDTDPRWDVFNTFHSLLEELFPLVHKNLELRKVNRYGLLYTFRGSNADLKPILFMAHQDVVPVNVNASWTYPPYEGHYDGSFLWGRGASDCKNVLIGILSVIEDLLEQKFTPQRTVVLSFGFDEETGGERGASTLSKAIVQTWGKDAFVLALDEGGMGLQELGGALYAYPGIGEKGHVNIDLTLNVKGGHSSRPPVHTGIGIVADLIVALEKHPYTPRLGQANPFRRVLECRAQHSPGQVQPWLHDALLQSDDEEQIAQRLASDSEDDRWLMQTSQAVDIIEGGIKVNALPEEVRVVVNQRVALHESTAFVESRVRDVLTPVAQKHGIRLVGGSEGEGIVAGSTSAEMSATTTGDRGVLRVESAAGMEPAPISPTDNGVWALFSGTLRSVFETTETGTGKTVVPVGSTMTGNTDTKHYWDVTKNIYRYTPSRDGTRFDAHGIDERQEITAHLEGMRLYYDLIRNFDVWTEE